MALYRVSHVVAHLVLCLRQQVFSNWPKVKICRGEWGYYLLALSKPGINVSISLSLRLPRLPQAPKLRRWTCAAQPSGAAAVRTNAHSPHRKALRSSVALRPRQPAAL
eukprot:COSAG06_NODE_30310_length_541_cov_0.751131_1_plen_107_part_01